jgi:hypothetical protein
MDSDIMYTCTTGMMPKVEEELMQITIHTKKDSGKICAERILDFLFKMEFG